jgi:hypothetical protein
MYRKRVQDNCSGHNDHGLNFVNVHRFANGERIEREKVCLLYRALT